MSILGPPPGYDPEIPVRHCPNLNCEGRPMIVGAMIPGAYVRQGTTVTYRCTKCGMTETEIIKNDP